MSPLLPRLQLQNAASATKHFGIELPLAAVRWNISMLQQGPTLLPVAAVAQSNDGEIHLSRQSELSRFFTFSAVRLSGKQPMWVS